MNRHFHGCEDARSSVLVASGSTLFLQIVGDLLADSGLVAAFPAESEAAWLSLTRTQPVLVICDCAGPADKIERLIVEVAARRLPLVMTSSTGEYDDYARRLVLPDRIAWLTFPIVRDAFRATIDRLVPPMRTPMRTPVRRLTLAGGGITVEAAVGVRTFDEVLSDRASNAAPPRAPRPDRAMNRSIRLLP